MDYQKQAQDFLRKHNLTFKAERRSDACPPFCNDEKHIHGAEYTITIERGDCSRKIVFPFWNSFQDEKGKQPYPSARTIWQEEQNKIATQKHKPKAPDAYSVLACLSGDINCAECFEDFCADFGYDTDSRRALDSFLACSSFAAKLRGFFTEQEKTDLLEIQ